MRRYSFRKHFFYAAVLTLASSTPRAAAQQYLISTLAGGAPAPTPSLALSASIGAPNGVAVDSAGNFYFSGNQCVFKVDRNGVLTRVAGNSRRGYSGDGGPAINAELRAPYGVAVDAAGNVYIADELNQRIRKVLPSGTIVTVAGNGTAGFSGDGGPAANAQLNNPLNVLVDASGNLFIADLSNNRIRKVTPSGIISTIAGGGASNPGDNGAATSAVISNPSGMAFDATGNLFIADRGAMRLRKVAPTGIITTVAGTGTQGSSGDGGAAADAELFLPTGVVVSAAGDLFIADFGNNRIRNISSSGVITTVPGLTLTGPSGVALDAAGNLYVADQGNRRIQRVVPGGNPSTVAGNRIESFSGDGGPAVSAQLNLTSDVAVDSSGNVYIADFVNGGIRKISPGGAINSVGGLNAVGRADGLTVDSSGNLYVADGGTSRVFKVSPSGVVSIVAGNGTQGSSGDGGPATSAQLTIVGPVAVDNSGNIYIAELDHVRKVTSAGVISTFYGVSTPFPVPAVSGLALDSGGNLFVAIGSVVKVSPSGVANVVLPLDASAGSPFLGRIALDSAGNIYATIGNSILKISTAGVKATIAGGEAAGYSGDGGPANGAQLYLPRGIAVDAAGKVYFTDYANFAVRLLTPANQSVIIGAVVDAASESVAPLSPGKIVVIYGSGLGPATPAQFQTSNGVIPSQLAGTSISFNGASAPVLYASATQVSAIVPYALTGTTAQVTVTFQGQTSLPFPVAAAPAAPSLFTANGTGAGPAAAINVAGGALNTASNPAAIGSYVSLYATGEGATTPAGIDGKPAAAPLPQPTLPVKVTVGGLPAVVQYYGGAPGQVAGLLQVNVQIPPGVPAGGYVPVVLTVGDASTVAGAVWISVAGN